MIRFEPKDFKSEHINRRVDSLIGALVGMAKANKFCEDMILAFIPKFHNVNQLNPSNEDDYQLLFLNWVDIQVGLSKIEKDKFINLVSCIYIEIEIKSKVNRVQNEILGIIRGKLLESILSMKLVEKYSRLRLETYNVGCQVVIKDVPICSDSNKNEQNSTKRITVDFAGINRRALRGEFYEFKVGPMYFDKTTFEILKNIKEKIQSECSSKYILNMACYVCEDLDAVTRKIDEWGLDKSIKVYSNKTLDQFVSFSLVS